jgi:hypothetical protein
MPIPLAQRLALLAVGGGLIVSALAAPARAQQPAPTQQPAPAQSPAPSAAAPAAAGEPGAPAQPRPPLVESVGVWNFCVPARYEGPQTSLYLGSNHFTATTVAQLLAHEFCRGRRAGKAAWMLAVSKATTLYALAPTGSGLEQAGWRRVKASVRVEAEDVPFDALYALEVPVGRYLVHQDHAEPALPVFWNPQAVRVLAPSAGRGAGPRP